MVAVSRAGYTRCDGARLLDARVAGRNVGADDVDRPAGGVQEDRGSAGGQVAHPAAEVVRVRLDLAGDHRSVVAVLRFGVGNVVAGGGGVGEQSAAGAVLGLGEYQHVLASTGQPANRKCVAAWW